MGVVAPVVRPHVGDANRAMPRLQGAHPIHAAEGRSWRSAWPERRLSTQTRALEAQTLPPPPFHWAYSSGPFHGRVLVVPSGWCSVQSGHTLTEPIAIPAYRKHPVSEARVAAHVQERPSPLTCEPSFAPLRDGRNCFRTVLIHPGVDCPPHELLDLDALIQSGLLDFLVAGRLNAIAQEALSFCTGPFASRALTRPT